MASTGVVITEGVDAASGVTTIYSMDVDDTFNGTLFVGDTDWIAITLEAGETYEISLEGAGSGAGTVQDTYLTIYDANGRYVTQNDDGGADFDSRVNAFTATTNGTYYISAGSYADSYSGTYTVSVTGVEAPDPTDVGTFEEMADFLIDGYWDGYQFDTSDSNILTVDLTDLTNAGQQLARWALDAWEMVADLEFVEVFNGAEITFDDEDSGAYAGPDELAADGSTIIESIVNVDSNWITWYGGDLNSYTMLTYIHEIGHALGLGHQGDYNGAGTYGVDNTFANDSWQVSVMSYFSQLDNTTVDATEALPVTAMLVDIIAIQELYGASTLSQGDTIWGDGGSFGTYLDDVVDGLAGGDGNGNLEGSFDLALTIYDHSGTDTIDLSFLTSEISLNLNGGTFSDINGGIGNLAIAVDTVIENANLGSGNDYVTANGVANVISTGGGNDTIYDVSTGDEIDGGSGADTVHIDIDVSDIIDGSYDGETITIFTVDGQQEFIGVEHFLFNDQSLDEGDLITLVEDLESNRTTIIGSTGNDALLLGTNAADDINARAGSDYVEALGGDDIVAGGIGADVIYGGNGDDEVRGADGFDSIYGDDGDDTLFGNNGSDLLSGGAGNDSISGGLGADDISGGIGNDILSGDNGADILSGDDGQDTLFGNFGNDTLNGGNGSDVLYGGLGFDELHGDSGGDEIFGMAGADSVYGGDGNDTLNGNDGHDFVYGDTGDDFIYGGLANDQLFGGAGDDTISGANGRDILYGGVDNDVLYGGGGNDTLEGGSGNDVIGGGTGVDTFIFETGDGSDTITDFAAGADTLELSYELLDGLSLQNFANTVGGNLTLTFDSGDELTFTNGLSLTQLESSVTYFYEII